MIPLGSILHEIFSDNAEEYIRAFNPPYTHVKALNHIRSCRTPAQGAAIYDCPCGERTFVYHSCRDRHCPVCQGMNNARWAEKQLAASLPVKYYHVVFTLPDSLDGFALAHPKESYDALFDAASASLLKLCSDKKHLGATPGFTAVLHTWGQTMQFHPHLHAVVTAGGLADNGLRFVDKSGSDYLLPVKALAKLFRGIFIDILDKKGLLSPGMKQQLYAKDFSCHLEAPMERADNAVMYLSRYTHRVCISDKRIVSYDRETKTVTFSYKDNKDAGRQKTMTLSALEFMRRFFLHILPKRFMKIRHYGILANHKKFGRIAQCKRLIHAPMTPLKKFGRQKRDCPACGKPLPKPSHLDARELRLILIC